MSDNKPVGSYGRGTKIVFAFMAFLMSVGFLVLILQSVPGFSAAFGGPQTGGNATKKLVKDAQKQVEQHHCKAGMTNKSDISKCRSALEDLAAGYRTLASPNTSNNPNAQPPKDAQHNLDRMLEAYRLRSEIDPKSTTARADYASALSSLGKSKEAFDIFAQLVKEKPDDPSYAIGYAEAAQGSGKTAEAKVAWKSFIKRFPDDASIELAKEQLKALNAPAGAGASSGAVPVR